MDEVVENVQSLMNLSREKIVIHVKGKELDVVIRDALKTAAMTLIEFYDYSLNDIDKITGSSSDSFIVLLPVKFIINRTLLSEKEFDSNYIHNVYVSYSKSNELSKKGLNNFYLVDGNERGYATGNNTAKVSKKVMGLFLSLLHYSGSITLPYNYNFPTVNVKPTISLKPSKSANRIYNISPSSKKVGICAPFATELIKKLRSVGLLNKNISSLLVSSLSNSARVRLSNQGAKLVLVLG